MIESMQFQDVSFTYPNSKTPALKNVNLTIGHGETVVIVGENGSGKTTLSKLMTGVYVPDSGEISCDRMDIAHYDRESYHRSFGIVSQNFVQYHLTLRENIAMGAPALLHDDATLLAHAKAAGLAHVIAALGGLDTPLGRDFDGAELSGGQWQKLAIARGLAAGGDIMILDEPTSALDPLVEFEILSQFLDMAQGRTAVIISHRVGICKRANRIIVMDGGRVVGMGTHETLLAQCQQYATLWQEQAQWYA